MTLQPAATSLQTDRLQALLEIRKAVEPVLEPELLLAVISALAQPVLGFETARLRLLGPDGAARAVAWPDAGAPLAVNAETHTQLLVAGVPAGELTLGFGGSKGRESGDQAADGLFVALLAHELEGALERSSLGKLAQRETQRSAADDAFEQLLRVLGNVLNIRDVFPDVSAIASRILPHDRLTMSFHDAGGSCVIQAVSNGDGPSVVRVTGVDPTRLVEGSFKLIPDLTRDKPDAIYEPPDTRQQIVAAGYRSLLSVCLSARKQLFGLQFWSKRLAGFAPEQVPMARRVAEHVALAVSHQQLAEAAHRAAAPQARAERLEARVQSLSEELDLSRGYGRVIGSSERWKAILKSATQVAFTDTTVLLTGESGTGKEVIARFIHRASGRGLGPFVAVNCAALPEQLLESELFGHERGAFTGAQHTKLGQIELAAGGVLFLDEVSEMSLSAQAKFLRVIQEREFIRLGGTRTIKANVRIIAATNRELRRALTRHDFREDLYYRLQVFEIRLPPLRDRRDDISALSEAFLSDIGRAFGRPPAGMTREARQVLLGYDWPGNVRELRNVLERAVIVSEGGLIAPEHLSLQSEEPASDAGGSTNVKAIERQLIEQVLRECQGNKSQAARRLGLTRKQLYVRLQKYESELGSAPDRAALLRS